MVPLPRPAGRDGWTCVGPGVDGVAGGHGGRGGGGGDGWLPVVSGWLHGRGCSWSEATLASGMDGVPTRGGLSLALVGRLIMVV